MANFKMGFDNVWRNISGSQEKLTKKDISDMIKTNKGKDLLLSLDNCTVDESAFSSCPFESVTIVSGNNLQNLSFIKTGTKLKELGVGRFLDKNKDVPNVLGSKFPKLNNIELSDCPGLEKFVIKSNLKGKVEVIQEDCPEFKGNLETEKDNDNPSNKEETTLENFTMESNGVWKNSSDNKIKLKRIDIDKMYKKQQKNKNEKQKPDKLLISLDNCILDEETFSKCPFRSITIVSGNNIEVLYFCRTGHLLKRIGIGKFADNKDVPSKWKGKFPKLKKIEALNCSGLTKIMIKSNLDVDISHEKCPNFNDNAEIHAKRDMDEYFDENQDLKSGTIKLEYYKKNTSQRLMNNGFEVVRFLGDGGSGIVWECIKGGKRYVATVMCNPSDFDNILGIRPFLREIDGNLSKEGLIIDKIFKPIKGRGIFIAPISSKNLDSRMFQPATKAPSKTKGYKDFQSIEDIQDFMKSLLTSLNELHNSGYVHRDINPKNIIVDKVVNENGKKKLTYTIGGLGLATHKDDYTGLATLTGDFRFLPPETGYIDGTLKGAFRPYKSFEAAKKGDIFALGFSFRLRLDDELEGNKYNAKKAKEAIILINKMMSDDPNKRPTIGQALRDPFFK